ncbi:MAG: BlaI/MecI/CopY family transcriptional regulator [bacterium]
MKSETIPEAEKSERSESGSTTRLVAKKAVSERKRGNTSVYEPLISRKKTRRSALSSLLNQAFDGAVEPLLHFLVEDQKLSKKQRQELIKFLQEEDSKSRGKNDQSNQSDRTGMVELDGSHVLASQSAHSLDWHD